ncbi:Serine carboxypeptidase-like 25 isoform 1 [Hibiscus syriacus]|uniref:Exocyst subunit Exo70 family protein n=1 Tax=Hibiscus syriacus TaxID=106335 RepID=A0A6A3AV40_HIBSY|nr:Serine carboxypeptidase-like 25 isoform 1 [Hibiscus syriacus]
MVWDSSSGGAVEYLNAVDEACKLEKLENQCSDRKEEKDLLRRAYDVLQMAMQRLEEEFRHLLVHHWQPFDPECIVSLMFKSNYGLECCLAYVIVIKEALAECLFNQEMERLSIEDVLNMEWGALDSKIKRWIRTMKVFIRPYLASEKWLCDQVFADLGSANFDKYDSSSGSISGTLVKKRLRRFYAAVEEVYKTQTAWLILDVQLREDLRIWTSLKVIQAYRTFIGRQMHRIGKKHGT